MITAPRNETRPAFDRSLILPKVLLEWRGVLVCRASNGLYIVKRPSDETMKRLQDKQA